jgi:nucleoside-diphosphate-sugar epimerase
MTLNAESFGLPFISKPRVLVTGANGYIGSAVCNLLKDRQFEVVQAVRKRKVAYQVEVGEIGPETDWIQALNGCDTVVHLAARAHITRERASDPLEAYRRVNVVGSDRLARAAARAGAKRLVFISSVGVNGASTTLDGIFTERTPPAPHNAYALSKYEAEITMLEISRETGIEVVLIRPPLVYGPNAPGNFGLLLRWLHRGIPLPLGSVCNKRSFVALENLVDFIALCADRDNSPKAANEVFLISDGEDVSTPELLRRVAHAHGTSAHLIPMPPSWLGMMAKLIGKSATVDSLLNSLVIDSTKTKDLLGWRPIISMDEQLRKIAQTGAPL